MVTEDVRRHHIKDIYSGFLKKKPTTQKNPQTVTLNIKAILSSLQN